MRNKHVVNNSELNPKALTAVLSYLYTLRFEVDLDKAESVLQLAMYYELQDLTKEINIKLRRINTSQTKHPELNLKVLILEPRAKCTTLHDDFRVLGVYDSVYAIPRAAQLPVYQKSESVCDDDSLLHVQKT